MVGAAMRSSGLSLQLHISPNTKELATVEEERRTKGGVLDLGETSLEDLRNPKRHRQRVFDECVEQPAWRVTLVQMRLRVLEPRGAVSCYGEDLVPGNHRCYVQRSSGARYKIGQCSLVVDKMSAEREGTAAAPSR